MKFSELTQAALLGTERQALTLAGGDSELNRLLAQLDVSQREETLLSAAAMVGLHEEIGSLSAQDAAPAPALCAAETLPRMSERANSLVRRLLDNEFPELLPEALMLANRAGQIVFPEALPALLNVGRAKMELRETILNALGQRGRWLAALNPEWAWAIGATDDDENIWQVGDGAPRRLFLQRLRRTNPARARELLMATWPTETPEDRAHFISVWETGLSTDDEQFLEAALDDKRKEVRRQAATLLARLPGSALVRRMIERAKLFLKFSPGEAGSLLKLKKPKPATLEITLPDECDKLMQRDGIEPKPQAGFGEKAWWLIQMLEAVPLTRWTAEWNVPPSEIIKASLAGEWKKELFEAWLRAACRQRNADWAGALFVIALPAKRVDTFEGLLAALPLAQRELRLTAVLMADDDKTRELQGTLLAQCRHDWSPEFSRAVLAWLHRITAQLSHDWQLRNQLKDFAARLNVSTLDEAATGWPTASPGWEFWAKGVDDFLALVQFRSQLHHAFPQ